MQQRVLNGRYELISKIGEGGMARVYRSIDLRLGRPVAVKVLHSHYAGDATFVSRFEHEARAAASLADPRIVDVYDVGQDGDTHYIVMELVEGTDLKALLKSRGTLPINQAVLVAEQVAEGLQTAHGIGLIHRDVKPQNIMITPTGHVTITDFGIAKGHLSSTITETGVTFGTADYISPEQAQGQPATACSDIYALGVVLYELLTGRLPFSGESSVAVAMQHVRDEPPPPSRFNPQIPPQLESLVLRAMAKNQEERPQSASEFAQQLRDYLYLGSQATMMTARPAGAPQQVLATATAGIGGVSGGGARRLPPPASTMPAAPPRSGGVGTILVGLAIVVGALALIVWFGTNLFEGTRPTSGTGGAATSGPQQTLTAESGVAVPITATTTLPRTTTPTRTRTPTVTATATPTPTLTATATAVPSVTLATSLLGRTERELLDELQRLQLTPFAAPPRNDDAVPEDNVVEIVPLPGTPVAQGSTITYTLSLGPLAIPVPDLKGVILAAAESQLRGLGFDVVIEETPDAVVPAGRVIDQVPSGAGRKLPKGASVTLFVSVGNKVRVPNIYLKPVREARVLLEQAGLRIYVVDCQNAGRAGAEAGRPPGTVISSIPASGTLVDPGSSVVLGVRSDLPQCEP